MILITSRTNSKIKHLVRLRERRERERSQQLLIEGYRELLRASEGNYPVEELYYCEQLFLGKNERELLDYFSSRGCRLFPCTQEVFAKISYRDRPDGLLGTGPQCHHSLNDLEKHLSQQSNPPFLLFVEKIEKPGNLGTILRSCDAAGVDGIVLCDPCTDLFNPNVVRASVGTLFTQKIVETSSEAALQWARTQGIQVVAATPQATTRYTEANLRGPTAIVVGSEQLGLTPLWLSCADCSLHIPMKGYADSLNVATTTTLFLFELVRQRG